MDGRELDSKELLIEREIFDDDDVSGGEDLGG